MAESDVHIVPRVSERNAAEAAKVAPARTPAGAKFDRRDYITAAIIIVLVLIVVLLTAYIYRNRTGDVPDPPVERKQCPTPATPTHPPIIVDTTAEVANHGPTITPITDEPEQHAADELAEQPADAPSTLESIAAREFQPRSPDTQTQEEPQEAKPAVKGRASRKKPTPAN